MDQASEGRSKVLFMDDDPARGASFLAEYPDAVWVRTAKIIAHLAEPWDEVHLDHDLGGDVFVDFERDDCGMAVVHGSVPSRGPTWRKPGSSSTLTTSTRPA